MEKLIGRRFWTLSGRGMKTIIAIAVLMSVTPAAGWMLKNLTKIEIIQGGDERFLLKVYADGSEGASVHREAPKETAALSIS